MSVPSVLENAAQEKKLVIFAGAGVSKNCRNSKGEKMLGWRELLEKLGDLDIYSPKVRQTVSKLVDAGRLLDAAECLKYHADHLGDMSEFETRFKELIEGGDRSHFRKSEWHEEILKINPSIIITTNYDKIFERDPNFYYEVQQYDSKRLGDRVRANASLFIKLHGTSDNPGEMILARRDYSKLQRRGVHTLNVVKALMMTHTFLFVGYSLGDPDLQIMLQDLFSHQSISSPHFMLAGHDLADYQAAFMKECYGIHVLRGKKGDNEDYGFSVLKEISRRYEMLEPLPGI